MNRAFSGSLKGQSMSHSEILRREKSGELYKEIVNLLPIYLTIQDRDLNIIFANQTFYDEFGPRLGKKCHFVYKGSLNKCRACPVQKTFSDKKVHLSEETIRTHGGKTAQMIVYSAPILDQAGNVVSVMEMATNITRVKVMQKELTELGQSIALMSHGVKNILEGLQGGSYVVDEGLHDGDLTLIQRGWGIVKNNITDISRIVQNILYSSKKRTILLERVAPGDIIKDSINLFRGKARSERIELSCEINPALPEVNMDPFAIRKMMNNLISNAIEACAKDKSKSSHRIVVRADDYNELQFKYEVEDNGIGMDERTRLQIFTEFFSTKGTEGTGLGLAVVDKIVKEHKGKIEVDSTPLIGTLFRILFLKM